APAAPPAVAVRRPLLVAVAGPDALQISAMSVPLARARGGDVHVVHVVEEDVTAGEDAVELETSAAARALLEQSVAELRASGMAVRGELLHTVGNHADVAAGILKRASELQAGAIVIGPDAHHGRLLSPVAAVIAEHARAHVIVLHPEAGPLGSSQPRLAA
ncbi:MAG TPA: universal stress protein, partial [Solirubrobacteraceae bacterium]|nr:universal stress protein [Solirubrobacteraceae bacterium]